MTDTGAHRRVAHAEPETRGSRSHVQTRGAVKTRLWSQATLSLSLDSAGPQLSHLYSGMVAPDEVPALLHAVLRASSLGGCPTPSLSPPTSHPSPSAPQETGRLRPAAGGRRHGAAGGARLQVRLHLHPGAVPQPRAEGAGQDQEKMRGWPVLARSLPSAPRRRRGWAGGPSLNCIKGCFVKSCLAPRGSLPTPPGASLALG